MTERRASPWSSRPSASSLALAMLGISATLGACAPRPADAPAPPPVPAKVTLPAVGPSELRAPEAFAAIGDRTERSRALFLEATRVMLHPRCANCHPSDDSPRQRDDFQIHDPPVARGPDDKGLPALQCTSCHQDANVPLARVPGAPNWHLAPLKMAWIGHSAGAICEQLKDPARNGGRTLAQIVDHSAHDKLVGWGWSPGSGRTPAPGDQARFGDLMAAWVESGAACPREEASR